MDTFWLDDPSIIYDKDELMTFYPNADMTMGEKLNSMLRLSIYIGLILILVKQSINYIFLPISVALLTIIIYKKQEDFCNIDGLKGLTELNIPTIDNPYMNFNQITDERNKETALPYTRKMGQKMDELFY